MSGEARIPDPSLHSHRSWGLLGAIAALLAVSVVFYLRQNFAGQIGGRMSLPKLLWLDYALIAWYLLPIAFWRSPRIEPALRRIYGAHLASFAARGLIELFMLYVAIAWKPPYGIAHDLFNIALISALIGAARSPLRERRDPANRAARRFLTSIRLVLCCEIVFA